MTGGRAPRSSELLAQLRQRAQQAASAGDDSTEEVRWRSPWGTRFAGLAF